jgi:hypothetical protein
LNTQDIITVKGAAMAGGSTTHGVGSDGTLTVTAECLRIESGVGSFSFRPDDVLLVTRSGFIPWFWGGIRVTHQVPAYPSDIGFFPRKLSSGDLIKLLQKYGFGNAVGV